MKDNDDQHASNDSGNSDLAAILGCNRLRRRLLQGGLGAAGLAVFGTVSPPGRAAPAATRPRISFAPIAPSADDAVRVSPGYSVQVLFAWGDPVSDGPPFRSDATNSAEEQALQAGMHHDGMHFFPFHESGAASSVRGLLCVNHEYVDDGLLHPDGMKNWDALKVAKSKAAHGVSVIEVRLRQGCWQVVRPSRFARRITASTPILLGGPAAGSPLVSSADDPFGHLCLGTLANCAHGVTPWGTYLSCEENFNGYFAASDPAQLTSDHRRYGIAARGYGYRWHESDNRFDVALTPTEPNRFGWVVEIDPWDSGSLPVKRTALGRFKHEGATTVLAADGRAVVYMGDDERFEYIYKFVSRGRYNPQDKEANRDLLDEGTLFVARFDADGKGRWLELTHGKGGLTAANGFRDQAEVAVRTRQAADVVGATKMDRPEWIAVHPRSNDVYCALTNNSQRGASGMPGPDAANPRANNTFGHIVRWREAGGNPSALTFRWGIFVLCGDPASAERDRQGNIKGDIFGSPDGLWFDADGRLWIATDVSPASLNRGEYARLGNNQLLCADVATGEVRRFLTGPVGCEITGMVGTPDRRTLFVNIQHPGEVAGNRSDPHKPKAGSSWPDGEQGGRPRSATIAIRRTDGGAVGT
jgi:hypothetical protein